MVPLDLDDIQGNILRGYGVPRAEYLFLKMHNAAAGRAFLRSTVNDVTTAAWPERPATTTNVALTYSGLRTLGVDDAILSELPVAFREPMRERAPRVLDDTGPSAPKFWDEQLGTGDVHLLVMIAGCDPEDDAALTDAVGMLRQRMGGLEEALPPQRVEALRNAREHFGWADGLGQPAIEGVPKNRAGQGVPQEGARGWRDLKAGEFILGYPDEDGQILSGPALPLLRNGSFMVYRKLRQDVPRFRELLSEAARSYAQALNLDATVNPEELLAAKLVGRWRDGVAIELADRRPADETQDLISQARTPDNDFRYSGDSDGFRCPKGAHIRRANPRDEGGDRTMASRHRIIRRGMPYGEPFDERRVDNQERGLIFICFNADFERQFETVQAQWCNDGNAFGLGDDRDWLVGGNGSPAKVTIQGRPPFFAPTDPRIVLTRGCEYLLMPGINALRDLAEPRPGLGRP
jgi:Dyp-type peroxidase family